MKTIEEAIDQAIQKFLAQSADDSLYNTDEVCDLLCDLSKHIMSLPLAERLTAEEREKIKTEYEKICDSIAKHSSTTGSLFFIGQKQTMESIFGAAMFAEKGGSE